MGAILMAPLSRTFWRAAFFWTLLATANGVLANDIDMGRAALIKSVYLKNIAVHTTWPPQKVGDDQRPIVIGVLGGDPNGVIAPMQVKISEPAGLKAQGRQLQLVKLDAPSIDSDGLAAVLEGCHLLFLSEDGEGHWARIKPLVETMPIVTVSEYKSFASQGGMIEYIIDRRAGKVRMIINIGAVKRAGLVLSARLLGLKEAVILINEGEDAE